MKAGEKLRVRGEDLAFGGETVCHDPGSGLVVFVPFMAPGDLALVRVEHVRARYARARVLDILEPGPDRVEPECPIFGVCGGCQWQHVALRAQRAAKERIVRHALEPLGFADRLASLRDEGGGYGYRNRLLLPVRAGRSGLRAGFFQARTHRIVETDSCLVQDRRLGEAAAAVVRTARDAGVRGYAEKTGRGVLRHLLIRAGSGTGEVGVVLVTAAADFPQGEALAWEMMRRHPAIVGVVQNVNPARTNVILSSDNRPLGGRDRVTERIGELELRSSFPAFFQANAPVAERLARLVREWAGEERGGVLDLYCGGGLLGLAALRSGVPSWLIGVEEAPVAVADARANAAAGTGPGNAGSAAFEQGIVEEVLPRLGSRLSGLATVVVDPPRKGLSPEALRAVTEAGPRQIVYVSCDPMTFARDLKAFAAAGYAAETVIPLDMFPQTYHVELAARLRKRG